MMIMMKTMISHQSLPGIKSIGFVDPEYLQPNVAFKSIAGIPVGVFCIINSISLCGDASCEAVTEYDNNGRSQKTTLKFSTTDVLPTYFKLAFIVADTNGDSYLIGAKENPYPVIKCSKSFGTPSGDPAVYSYEISLSALKSLIPCRI